MEIFPMNAQECKDPVKRKRILADPEYVYETKWNGYRQLSNSGEFFSRSISVVTGEQVSKTNWVPHITDLLKAFPGWHFDGELLLYPKGKAKDVTRIMQSSCEVAIEKQKALGRLTYMLFDVLETPQHGDITSWPWEKRRAILEGFFFDNLLDQLTEDLRYIRLSTVHYPESENIEDFIEITQQKKLEGVMAKNRKATYKPSPKGGDSRPANTWYKIKFEEVPSEDVVVIGFKDPEQFYKDAFGKIDTTRETKFYKNGWIGGVLIGQYVDGELTPVGSFSGIPEVTRADISSNRDKYLGRVVEIKAFEREPSGRFISPVFVQWRLDKRAVECTWVK